MPIPVISKFKPINNGQFPVVEDIDVQGGFSTVDTLVDRDNIPLENRKEGMLVFVIATETYYTLKGGTSNANWSFPIIKDTDIKGGYQVVDTLVDRDNIPSDSRKEGMLVFVISDGNYYVLKSGISNSDWYPARFSVVIPSGGEIGGYYPQDVFCEGSATIVGNLTVGGSLTCSDALINSDGYNVTINGDLRANDLFFNHSDPLQAQGTVLVKGNARIYSNIYFHQTASSLSYFNVYGDLSVDNFEGYGLDDANGLNVNINGDCTIKSAFSISGGDASATSSAGNGGQLIVNGSWEGSINSNGGNNSIGGNAGNGGLISIRGNLVRSIVSSVGGNLTNGSAAGNGGQLIVSGSIESTIYFTETIKPTTPTINLSGGNGIDANGGDGGFLGVGGSASIYIAELKGGNSNYTSLSAGNSAGAGGIASIKGTYSGEILNCSGGNGIGASGGNAFLKNFGFVLQDWQKGFFGDVTLFDFIAKGGDCNSDSESHSIGCGGGNPDGTSGQDIKFYGNLTASNEINVSGGNRTGALTANGSYRGGYAGKLIIHGNCTAKDIYSLGGNCYTTGGTPGTEAAVPGKLTVKGNLACLNVFGYGSLATSPSTPGGEGLSLEVLGSAVVKEYIEIYGGTGNSGGNGADSGNIEIYGNLNVGSIFAEGGSSTSGTQAGNGGDIRVYGNIEAGSISIYGGNGSTASAGNGGNIFVSRQLTTSILESYGGSCVSDNHTHRAGSGGNVSSKLIIAENIDLSGGLRTGTLSSSNSLTPPNAGNLTADIITVSQDIILTGGVIGTSGFSPSTAGKGGDVTARQLYAYTISLEGGTATVGDAGEGGSIDVDGDINSSIISCDGGIASNGNGGNSGTIFAKGSLTATSGVTANGGNATSGNGGNSSPVSITIYGDIVCGSLERYGGNCNSTNRLHVAGTAGSIYCLGNASATTIRCDAGSRSGATTVAATNAANPGGSITVTGNLKVTAATTARGSSITTSYSNGNGGEGGTIQVGGDASLFDVILDGGNSAGDNGGDGGTMIITGKLTASDTVSLDGGNSNASTDIPAGGVDGSGGNFTVLNGCYVLTLSVTDGAGIGSAPTTSANIRLQGSCFFQSLTFTNRSGVKVRPYNSVSLVRLQIRTMPLKTSLSDSAGTDTGAITPTGNLFFYSGSDWYQLTGTIVP